MVTGPPGAGLGPRLAVTVGACAAWVLADHVPLPLLDPEALGIAAGQPLGAASIRAVGLTPLLTLYVLVEVVALLVPWLRVRRHGSARDRAPLDAAAWGLALLTAALQAWGIVTYLGTLRDVYGAPVLPPDAGSAFLVGVTIVAGVAAAGVLAPLVSRQGLGNGFAVLLAADALVQLLGWGLDAARRASTEWTGEDVILLLVLGVVGPLAFLRWRRGARSPAVPLPTCGLQPLTVTQSVLALPGALAPWFPALAGVVALLDGDGLYWGAAVLLAGAFALVLSHLFCSPSEVVASHVRAGRAVDEAALRGELAGARRASIGLVVLLAALPYVLSLLGNVQVSWADLVSGFVLVTVGLDLADEGRFRAASGALVSAWPLHRAHAVAPTLAMLAEAGIPAHARARRFRALWHFFAPYAPIEVLVPAERAAEAEALCARAAGAPAPTAELEPSAA